jgi:hypothetical protein
MDTDADGSKLEIGIKTRPDLGVLSHRIRRIQREKAGG